VLTVTIGSVMSTLRVQICVLNAYNHISSYYTIRAAENINHKPAYTTSKARFFQ